ncbi:hypothetical protein [Bradyrhizobium embrapense]|uniref:hypothetical protein n=1 Tax=Bradyrhizobium embrapense TaxID=630921 RepID=UPI00067C6B29|nr:hypothetical protein [Bradyrhizobium embrapense]
MLSTIVRAVPAALTALTLRDTIKSDLKISGTAEDAYIDEAIARASAMVCSHLRVTMADDGTRTLASEELIQTFLLRDQHRGLTKLVLARRPVTAIAYIKENDVDLTAEQYELEGRNGVLTRLRGLGFYQECFWRCRVKIEVRFTAGWLLPDQGAARTLPYDIESAVVDIVKGMRAARTRDPLLKSLDVQDIDAREYWVGGLAQGGGLPPDIQAKLAPYRSRSV